MAVDLPSRLAQIAAGQRRVRPLPTLLIALFVTALVAIPLTERVVRADDRSTGADPQAITVDMAQGDPQPLDGAVLSGRALIAVNDAKASGVSFNLFAEGSDEPLLASQDLSGPNFFPIRSSDGGGRAMDTTVLDDGWYELFVTVARADGEQRTAVRFEVRNP